MRKGSLFVSAGPAAAACVQALEGTRARKAIVFCGSHETGILVVKATRRHKPDRRARTEEFVVTCGKPNYAEREFIRKSKRNGTMTVFPRTIVQEYPKRA